ncbi:hypothetical protein [Actinacidiphila sp. ITFR-21]|uniref:hypothetical protein n=1 Tax=Actinacidiphila sp. ITFR-21 TaxID=3075199 RepID=UPI00288C4473|nr:hypothetical protein [Streptomyces sp. ITFR-21]WNI17960.1 hypothetical protein RLT57_22050 [Streptomyces sp. ITFR-21]
MRHERTEFVGGPLDGRVLDVLVGMTGQPPRVYTVPVPAPEGGGPERVHAYRREPNPGPRGERRTRWVFVHDPAGGRPDRLKWPWSRGA